ncbi:MAG: hypothetical protein LBS83_01410, partial [Holosporales bacterium]|nr:hypothetical protein [Holosporales bacterium]
MDKEENFSSHVVDLVKAKIILSELIGKDVHLQKKGEDFWGLCPFHNEKSASFTVSDQKGFYHCFGCGVHGDAISYIMSRQNVDFKESLKILSEQYGVALYKIKSKEQFQAFQQEKEKKEILLEIMEKAAEYFQKSLKNNKNSDMARKYLKSRGVSVESIDNFRIGYCDGTCASYLKDLGYSFELINEAGLIYGAEENFKN